MGIRWKKELETGIPVVDEQHRELFRRLNGFLDACDRGEETKHLVDMLSFLDDYSIEHFRTEEMVQARAGFTKAEAHREEHQRFSEELAELKKRFILQGPGPELVDEINRFVVGWLLSHIARSDREFAGTLDERMRSVEEGRR